MFGVLNKDTPKKAHLFKAGGMIEVQKHVIFVFQLREELLGQSNCNS
jgi:hypothetical protein